MKTKSKNTGYIVTYAMKCENLTYEVGKTYTSNLLEMYIYGFHYYKNIEDHTQTVKWSRFKYKFNRKNLVVIEIEILGDVINSKELCASNKIKVLRIIPKEEYSELIELPLEDVPNEYISPAIKQKYVNDDLGVFESEYTYDNKDRLVKIEQIGVNENIRLFTYDDNNICIKNEGKSDYGYNFNILYDSHGNMISYKDISGEQTWEYDSNDNMIKHTNLHGRVYEVTIE